MDLVSVTHTRRFDPFVIRWQQVLGVSDVIEMVQVMNYFSPRAA
jgi:hypothetical protein